MSIFTSIKLPGVKSSTFDLSHDVKTSFRMGELVPVFCTDVVPGDSFTIKPENMLRFAPLVSPVMHRVVVTTHFFMVPNRILWPEWEDFITGESDAEHPYVVPSISSSLPSIGSVMDYLGYPVNTAVVAGWEERYNAFPLAAYAKIWNEYYRDQNLQDPISDSLIAGDNSTIYVTGTSLNWDDVRPLRRAWQHDYFTSCLPFAQKGDAVAIPLTIQNDIPVDFQSGNYSPQLKEILTGNDATDGDLSSTSAGPDGGFIVSSGSTNNLGYDPDGSLTVDVQSDATDINTLRRAFRLQEWLERNARGGARYIENILSHFGVRSSDKRLNRPEYLGGLKQNMVISEVLATAETTDAGVNVGQMAGHGISVSGGNPIKCYAEEHGWIIGIINVQPTTAYQQGAHRSLLRDNRLDYFWPSFAHIGEQEVTGKELYMGPGAGSEYLDGTFGYIPRYSEYKYINSRVSGDMRDSLAFWHMGRIFDSPPELNEDFIEANPTTRIFAVETGDHIYAHLYFDVKARRKMPRFGVPTI